jgi:hypothetical protein
MIKLPGKFGQHIVYFGGGTAVSSGKMGAKSFLMEKK